MKIRIIFETMRLRVAFWSILCLLIGVFAMVAVEAGARTPDEKLPPAPNLPIELRDRVELQTHGSAGKMLLLEFYSDYCGVCKMMEPHVRQLEKAVSGQVHIERLDVGNPENEQYETYFGMYGTPGYILFDRDGKPLYRMNTRISPDVLKMQVLKHAQLAPIVKRPAVVPDQREDLTLVMLTSDDCRGCKTSESYLNGFELARQPNLAIARADAGNPDVKVFMKSLGLKKKDLPAYVGLTPDNRAVLKMTGTLNSPQRARALWETVQGLLDDGL